MSEWLDKWNGTLASLFQLIVSLTALAMIAYFLWKLYFG